MSLAEYYTLLQNRELLFSYQFKVTINSEWLNFGSDNVTLFATGTQLPNYAIDTLNVPYKGVLAKIPGTVVPADNWTVTIQATNDMKLYESFLNWAKSISNPNDKPHGRDWGFYSKDKAEVEVLKADDLKTATYRYKLDGIFPANIGAPTLDMASQELVKFTVQFQYNKFNP